MKTYQISIIALLLLFCISCRENIEKEAEEAAIIALIEEERDAFFARDFARFSETYVQDEDTRKYFLSSDGIQRYTGWTEVLEMDRKQIEGDVWEKTENVFANHLNYEVKVYGNTALVFNDTKWSGEYMGEELDLLQTRITHLVKEDGEWKIDFMAIYRIPDETEPGS